MTAHILNFKIMTSTLTVEQVECLHGLLSDKIIQLTASIYRQNEKGFDNSHSLSYRKYIREIRDNLTSELSHFPNDYIVILWNLTNDRLDHCIENGPDKYIPLLHSTCQKIYSLVQES